MKPNQRGGLDEEPFSYQVSKDNLFIFWNGKRAKALKGQEVEKVVGRLERSTPHTTFQCAQRLMAKTGNVKRGNERG